MPKPHTPQELDQTCCGALCSPGEPYTCECHSYVSVLQVGRRLHALRCYWQLDYDSRSVYGCQVQAHREQPACRVAPCLQLELLSPKVPSLRKQHFYVCLVEAGALASTARALRHSTWRKLLHADTQQWHTWLANT